MYQLDRHALWCAIRFDFYISHSDTYAWEPMPEFTGEGDAPCPRAGHAAAVVGTRIYVWSGRDGYKKVWNSQVPTHTVAWCMNERGKRERDVILVPPPFS